MREKERESACEREREREREREYENYRLVPVTEHVRPAGNF